jgi:hypothetical protein
MPGGSHIFYHELPNGDEVEVEVDYEITSFGYPATGPSYSSGGEPAEAPEFEISDIWVEGRSIPYRIRKPFFQRILSWFRKESSLMINPEFLYYEDIAWKEVDENGDFDPSDYGPDPDYYRD